MANWTKRFMELTKHIAGWSKDKSIGTCAVIVDDDNRVVSIGYNGFPSGCNDEIQSRYERPEKYLYTEHAERNAVFNAARLGVSTKGCTMYLMWFPCADCARSIIQAGIKKLVCNKPDLNSHWGDHFKAAIEMLDEAKVEVIYV
jgi:dCMP deaminase